MAIFSCHLASHHWDSSWVVEFLTCIRPSDSHGFCFAALAVRRLQHTSLTAMNVQAELADVQRRLRALQKKCSKRRLMQECAQKDRRCAPTSRACLFVFVQSGRATEVAVDFVSGMSRNARNSLLKLNGPIFGRPWRTLSCWKQNRESCAAGKISLLEHGSLLSACCLLGCKAECRARFVSRSQLVEQALANIPTLTPEDVKANLNMVLASSDRSQRRWLAKFRRRWGARLGILKPCSTLPLKEKQSKVQM